MYSKLSQNGMNVQNEEGVYMEFICDTAEDIAQLPTGRECGVYLDRPRPGSMAVCIAQKSLYTLSNQREWKLLSSDGA